VNLASSPRVESGRVRLELIAVSFVAALIGIACLITLSLEEEKFHTSGSDLDIRLIGVRPDASDDLYDVNGNQIGPRPFDGVNMIPWGSNMLRRDFIFDLPEGVVIQPVSYSIGNPQHHMASEFLPTNGITTGRTYTIETSFADFYWHSGFFFGGQRPLEFANVTLSFFLPERGAPVMRFPGPFKEGVTNKAQSATQQWWKCELVMTGASVTSGVTNAQFLFWTSHSYRLPGSLSFLDRQGRRHLPIVTNTFQNVGGLWESGGLIPGLNTNQIVAAEVHEPLTKTFHHIKVRYPERPVLTGPAMRGK
jgi:hypothetical protein